MELVHPDVCTQMLVGQVRSANVDLSSLIVECV